MTESLLQIIGPYFLIIGCSLWLNKSYFRKMIDEMGKSPLSSFIAGFVTFVLGALMVQHHPWWNTELEIFVSVISWLILIKGGLYLLLPEQMVAWGQYCFKDGKIRLNIFAVIYLLLGAYLTCEAFF